MSENKWIETKREVQTDSSGQVLNKNVTYEVAKGESKLTKKDYIDLALRIFGMVAIFIPIYLFYTAQNAEFNRQKSIFKFQTYSDLEAELHSFRNKHGDSISFEKSRDRILYELIPKAKLISQPDLKIYLDYMFNKVIFFHKYFLYDKSLQAYLKYFHQINLSDSTGQKYYLDVNLNIMERADNLANSLSEFIISNDSTETYADSLNNFLFKQLDALDTLKENRIYYNEVNFPVGKLNHYKYFREYLQLHSIRLEENAGDKYYDLINLALDKFNIKLKKFDSLVVNSNKYFQ